MSRRPWQSRWRGFYKSRGGRGGRGRGAETSRPSTSRARISQMETEITESEYLENFEENHPVELLNITDNSPSCYPGWRLYFPSEVYNESSDSVSNVKTTENYIRENKEKFNLKDIEQHKRYFIDIKNLPEDEGIKKNWSTFEQDLEVSPEMALNCLGLAMHQIIVEEVERQFREALEEEETEIPPINIPHIRARIVNFEHYTSLKDLKTIYFGKMVSVRGTVIRVGNLKLLPVHMAFTCDSCGALQCIRQPLGIFMCPRKCVSRQCRGKNFTPQHSSQYTSTTDWQKVRIQETYNDDQREEGRIPRTLDCELTADLIHTCSPGDDVTITGIMRIRETPPSQSRKGANLLTMFLDVISITNSKNFAGRSAKNRTELELNTKDFHAIQEIYAQPQLFRLLVHSLCPSIFGHELVKAGLLLGLAGGTNSSDHTQRNNIHVLMIGDPGLGKSQMLQACSNVAPRAIFVCGNMNSTAGLTVSLRRETGGNFALEAGALVLADQGVCCIDEFDKMGSQKQALLEAMEQQTISIAKGGMVCSLPARSTVLAAANPKGGCYNNAKTVKENLKMGSALLSRFDLIFILLDKPNKDLDKLLSEHLLDIHRRSVSQGIHSQVIKSQSQHFNDFQPLKTRLLLQDDDTLDPIPHLLLRKFLAYAQRWVQPHLSREAGQIIKEYYVNLRKRSFKDDATPVTIRKLKALIRLTQARARLELREEATARDALDVIEIMQFSLLDAPSDEFSQVDFVQTPSQSKISGRGQINIFINAVKRKSRLQSRVVFMFSELKEIASNSGLNLPDFQHFLSTLNTQGFFLKKGPELYQFLTND